MPYSIATKFWKHPIIKDKAFSVLHGLAQVVPIRILRRGDGKLSKGRLKRRYIMEEIRSGLKLPGLIFAAVTGIVMDNAASAPVSYPRVTVDVNRPFAYTIRETTSGTILLLGTLSK